MKVLVVDDEGIVLESCRRTLEPEGYEVLLVKSADEALQAIEAERSSLLLLDLKMPVHDGVYLMEKLQKSQIDIPIIVMTGFSTVETMQEIDKMGVSRFLPKPFTPDELLDAVRQVIDKEAPDGEKKSPCD